MGLPEPSKRAHRSPTRHVRHLTVLPILPSSDGRYVRDDLGWVQLESSRTYGLPLLAYLGFVVARGIMKAQARMRYADTKQALRDLEVSLPLPPSWISDKPTVEAFLNALMEMSIRRGIPAAYVNGMLTQDEFGVMMMNLVGHHERRGSSFPEQQRIGADFVMAAWERMPAEGKADLIQFQKLGSAFVKEARANGLID